MVGHPLTFDADYPDYYEFLYKELRKPRAAAEQDAAIVLSSAKESLEGAGLCSGEWLTGQSNG